MNVWRPNHGAAPAPGDEFAEVGARVFVRLANGREPAESWPVDTGRHATTRWSLTGSPFDIAAWRPA